MQVDSPQRHTTLWTLEISQCNIIAKRSSNRTHRRICVINQVIQKCLDDLCHQCLIVRKIGTQVRVNPRVSNVLC